MKVEQANELIATEIMGGSQMKFTSKGVIFTGYTPDVGYTGHFVPLHALRYDADYNLIMPVYKRIADMCNQLKQKTGYCISVEINIFPASEVRFHELIGVTYDNSTIYRPLFPPQTGKTLIEALHNAAVQFALWVS